MLFGIGFNRTIINEVQNAGKRKWIRWHESNYESPSLHVLFGESYQQLGRKVERDSFSRMNSRVRFTRDIILSWI